MLHRRTRRLSPPLRPTDRPPRLRFLMVIVAGVATADDDGNMLLGQLLHSPSATPTCTYSMTRGCVIPASLVEVSQFPKNGNCELNLIKHTMNKNYDSSGIGIGPLHVSLRDIGCSIHATSTMRLHFRAHALQVLLARSGFGRSCCFLMNAARSPTQRERQT